MATGNFGGTVVFALSEEDRERIDLLIETMKRLDLTEEQKKEVFFKTPDPEPTPEPEQPEPPKYTAAEIQAKVQKLAAPATGKRDAVKQIVNAYASRVSEIPEEQYAEVMARLTALEEGRA